MTCNGGTRLKLKPGCVFPTILWNALRLMKLAGLSKGEAIAHALHAAGYRPPGARG